MGRGEIPGACGTARFLRWQGDSPIREKRVGDSAGGSFQSSPATRPAATPAAKLAILLAVVLFTAANKPAEVWAVDLKGLGQVAAIDQPQAYLSLSTTPGGPP